MKTSANLPTVGKLVAVVSLVAASAVQAQLTPPEPPIAFELNSAAFSGTVTVSAPIFVTNTTNGVVPPGTIIAPVAFTGTVNDIDNVTQSYNRRTKLWTMNYAGGSSALTSASVLSNIVTKDYFGEGAIDTNITGWTFGVELDPSGVPVRSSFTPDGPPMLELFKITNNVVVDRLNQDAVGLFIDTGSSFRSGSVSFSAEGVPQAMTAVSRDWVGMFISPAAYTAPDDQDGIFYELGGISSNSLVQRTNSFVTTDVTENEPGVIVTNRTTNIVTWTSVAGSVPVTGRGFAGGDGGGGGVE
jgi:hypothetical protein